jgi:transcriptional regulator with XRE-family HTH domain
MLLFHDQNLTIQKVLFLHLDFVKQPPKDQLIMKNKNLRKTRERFNYSQEYVAGQLGISQSNYSRIENGSIKLDIGRLTKLAKLYQLELHTLLVCNEQQEKKCQHLNECHPSPNNLPEHPSAMMCIRRIEQIEKILGNLQLSRI